MPTRETGTQSPSGDPRGLQGHLADTQAQQAPGLRCSPYSIGSYGLPRVSACHSHVTGSHRAELQLTVRQSVQEGRRVGMDEGQLLERLEGDRGAACRHGQAAGSRAAGIHLVVTPSCPMPGQGGRCTQRLLT